jgi:hypothetical protein
MQVITNVQNEVGQALTEASDRADLIACRKIASPP